MARAEGAEAGKDGMERHGVSEVRFLVCWRRAAGDGRGLGPRGTETSSTHSNPGLVPRGWSRLLPGEARFPDLTSRWGLVDEAVRGCGALQEPGEDGTGCRPGRASNPQRLPASASRGCATLGLLLTTLRGEVLARPSLRAPEGPDPGASQLARPHHAGSGFSPPGLSELDALAGYRASRGVKGPGAAGDCGERRASAE